MSGKNKLNPCWNAPITAIIRTLIGCCAGPGALPNYSKPWPRGTLSTASMKSGIFLPKQRRTGLFAEYVNTWLKIKQESAGWPSWCQTLEQRREYILRYQEREGIRLDIPSIAKNPGNKATAKLMLNRLMHPFRCFSHFFFSFHSFWGKFGERMNKPTTVTVRDPAPTLISDSALDISTLRLCTDDILEAVYTSVNDNATKGTKTNIFVAAFTTCHARLKL